MIASISREESRAQRLPWVTFGIMTLCTAVVILTDLRGDEGSYERFGLVPAAPDLLSAATHMFLHGGWGHLIGNLLILFLAGAPLENCLGHRLFAGFYLASGLFAAGFYALLSPGSGVPMVGASGAIAALLGASLLRFWSIRVHFFHLFWAPLWTILPIWLATQLAMAGFTTPTGVTTAGASWCQVGGFVFGMGTTLAMQHWNVVEKFLQGVLAARVRVSNEPVLDTAMELRMQGDAQGAYELLRDAADEHVDDPDIVSAYWELACELRRAEEAVPRMVAVIKRGFARGDLDLAVRCWADITDRAPVSQVDRQMLVRLVPLLVDRDEEQRAVKTLREIVDPQRGPLSTGMAFRVLDMAKGLDPPTALVAARRALEAEDLADAKRERIQALANELVERCETLSTIAPQNRAPESADPAPPNDRGTEDAEMGIPLEYGSVYDFTLPSQSETVSSSASRELDASGSLVESDSAVELAGDSLPHELMAAAPALSRLSSEPAPPADGVASAVDFPMQKPPEAILPDAVSQLALEASASVSRFFGAKVIEARPLELREDALLMQRPNGKRGRVAYEAISALAVAAVGGCGSKPVLIIDLVLNWNDPVAEQVQVIRLRSDAFDVRRLISAELSSLDAFRSFQEQLLARSHAQPLPDRDAVRGRPFRRYDDLDRYQREVLQIDG
jgi:membrane associated rhomboid family serine protease